MRVDQGRIQGGGTRRHAPPLRSEGGTRGPLYRYIIAKVAFEIQKNNYKSQPRF